MKLNPYPVLLTTGALMFATVAFVQTGMDAQLLRTGAQAVDRDLSSLAAPSRAAERYQPAFSGRVLSLEPVSTVSLQFRNPAALPSVGAGSPDRVASIDRLGVVGDSRPASR